MMAAGLPVVGTAKAARGYAPRLAPGDLPGIHVAASLPAMAQALVALHEDAAAWAEAQAAALAHAAELGWAADGGGERGRGADVDVLLRACGAG